MAKLGANAVLATTLVDFSGKAKEGSSADARGGTYYKTTDIDHIFGTTVVTAEPVTAPSVFSVAGTVRITPNLFETSGAALVYSLDTKAKKPAVPRNGARRNHPGDRGAPASRQLALLAPADGRLAAYFASWNNVDGTQPSLPSSSEAFHHIPSFSPVG